MIESIQNVAISRLRLSDTGAQAERRKRFDSAAIDELAESIRSVGLLQPPVVRPLNGGGQFQIVAGERRYLAAGKAGLKEISVSVRDLSDEQVLEVQLVENLQREGLHELVEAEGYEALMKAHGYTVDDLVAKIGKSRAYVYGRLKLLALCAAARKAFFDSEISASIALLIARIPGEALQADALREVLENDLSFRDATRHVHENYMLKLGAAGFPTADAKLLPSAGPCGACPKRTGNQPELFGDVKGADVCTDPTCYRAKRDAWTRVRLDQARATGKRVIEGKEAKKLSPYGSVHHLEGGYVSLDAHCYEDAKNRTYRQLLGKGAETELLLLPGKRDDDEDTLVEIVKKSAVATALKDKGVKAPARDDRYAREQAATAKKVKLEQAYRVELVKRLQAARLEKLGEEARALSLMELRAVLDVFFDRLDGDAQARIAKVWGVEATKGKGGYGKEYSPPCTDPHRAARLILDCTYATDLHVSSYALKEKPTRLLAAAARYGVDPEAVRRELVAAEKAREKPAAKKAAPVTAKKKAKKA